VMTNGEESQTFKTRKGLWQGDPLSPLLFNLVADVLNRMLARASREGLMSGLHGEFRPGGFYPSNMQMIPCCSLLLTMNLLGI
jgi:hypothetical protein